MKKLILTLTLIISSVAFANDEAGTSFFDNSSSTNSSNSIGTVDDPDDPNEAPISDYALPLIASAALIGFYYSRKKNLAKVN